MKYLIKLDRFFAWTLLVSMMLFFVSGYGMTRGIIASDLAVKLHDNILPPVAIAAFTFHTWYAIHLAFKRWRIWSVLTATLLAIFYLGFCGYFGYMALSHASYNDNGDTASTASTTSAETSNSTVSSTNASGRVFTSQELAKYNGKGGQPAYIAVDGTVYDVSSLFINGVHRGCVAGQDASEEFHAIHAESILSGFEVMGTLAP